MEKKTTLPFENVKVGSLYKYMHFMLAGFTCINSTPMTAPWFLPPKASVEFWAYVFHLGDPTEGGEIGELELTPADSSPGAGGLLLQGGCHASGGDTSIESSGG